MRRACRRIRTLWHIFARCANKEQTDAGLLLSGGHQRALHEKCFAEAVYHIAIPVINGGVSMVIYFPVYKMSFPEGKPEEA